MVIGLLVLNVRLAESVRSARNANANSKFIELHGMGTSDAVVKGRSSGPAPPDPAKGLQVPVTMPHPRESAKSADQEGPAVLAKEKAMRAPFKKAAAFEWKPGKPQDYKTLTDLALRADECQGA